MALGHSDMQTEEVSGNRTADNKETLPVSLVTYWLSSKNVVSIPGGTRRPVQLV